MTLYVRVLDAGGASTCSGSCSLIYPPFVPPSSSLTLPSGATKQLAVITRDDGTQQVTYDGNPLYTYTGDFNPGDTNGAGIADIWLVAAP